MPASHLCPQLISLASNIDSAKIILLDYGNYPYLRSTARQLRANGLHIKYVYSSAFQSPHQSSALRDEADRNELAIGLDEEFKKYSFIRRRQQEIEWAAKCIARLEPEKPNIVLASNVPLEIQHRISRWAHRRAIRFVFWLQDLQGIAIRRLLGARWPLLGHCIGQYYERLERNILQRSDFVILISEDHRALLTLYGVAADRCAVLPNWALVDELPRLPKYNDWSVHHSLADTFNFLYSGTLGLKHDPELLARLASHFLDRPAVKVVVISEGPGAAWLLNAKRERRLSNLVVIPFQPYAELPKALASADVLVTLLDPAASQFSVPSKALTYLCAGRPLLMAVPAENQVAQLTTRLNVGLVAPPTSIDHFVAAAERLYSAPHTRMEMGERARKYAECEFETGQVCGRLKEIIDRAMSLPRLEGS